MSEDKNKPQFIVVYEDALEIANSGNDIKTTQQGIKNDLDGCMSEGEAAKRYVYKLYKVYNVTNPGLTIEEVK